MEEETDRLIYTTCMNDNSNSEPYLSYKYFISIFILFGSLFAILVVIIDITSNDFNEAHGKLLANKYIQIISNNPCIQKHGYHYHECINSSTILNVDTVSNKTIYRIAIHGDSLVSAPNVYYNFSSNILNKLSIKIPNLKFDIILCSKSAYNMVQILSNLDEDCLAFKPHSFIMYGDSDRRAFEERISDYKAELYISNLDILLHRLKQSGVVFIALSGPGLQGELPNGQNPDDYSAEAYRKANIEFAKSHTIPFIDVREALFKAEEANKGEYGYEHGSHGQYGYLTIDGAHPSYLGNEIIEDLLCKQLEEWYKTIN